MPSPSIRGSSTPVRGTGFIRGSKTFKRVASSALKRKRPMPTRSGKQLFMQFCNMGYCFTCTCFLTLWWCFLDSEESYKPDSDEERSRIGSMRKELPGKKAPAKRGTAATTVSRGSRGGGGRGSVSAASTRGSAG